MPSDVTHLLNAIENGNQNAADELLPLVYEDLRRLAAAKMSRENAGQTLQPTALVHEAWIKLVNSGDRLWNGRKHFFAAAAEAMRRILVDRARRRGRIRHGGELVKVPLTDLPKVETATDEQILRVDEALERFMQAAPEAAELVKLRFYVGLTMQEAMSTLGITEHTARQQWKFARAWFYRELNESEVKSEET